jgi:hypothetical protein
VLPLTPIMLRSLTDPLPLPDLRGFHQLFGVRLQAMKFLIVSLILLLSGASLARSKDMDDTCRGLNKKVSALISEYKALRERRSRLPEGVFDKDLRSHGGKLHRVLASLGEELGHAPFTKQQIVECVGEPDDVKNSEQMKRFLDIYHRELEKAGREIVESDSREYLIYHWRGGHDFLFFINENGAIVDHGWWFAYE